MCTARYTYSLDHTYSVFLLQVALLHPTVYTKLKKSVCTCRDVYSKYCTFHSRHVVVEKTNTLNNTLFYNCIKRSNKAERVDKFTCMNTTILYILCDYIV